MRKSLGVDEVEIERVDHTRGDAVAFSTRTLCGHEEKFSSVREI
jgi:hypothetical protein